MKRATLIAVALSLLALTACRDSDEDVLADACKEISQMQQALAALEALGPNSTIEQVQAAADEAREQAREAAQAVRRVEDQRWEELAEAQSDLADAVQNLDDDDSVGDARAQLQPYVQQVQAARQNLTASLKCP